MTDYIERLRDFLLQSHVAYSLLPSHTIPGIGISSHSSHKIYLPCWNSPPGSCINASLEEGLINVAGWQHNDLYFICSCAYAIRFRLWFTRPESYLYPELYSLSINRLRTKGGEEPSAAQHYIWELLDFGLVGGLWRKDLNTKTSTFNVCAIGARSHGLTIH